MKIYTKGGDKGQTSLLSGTRLAKYNLRIEAYGTVDELNAFTGYLRDLLVLDDVRETLFLIQNKLFNVGSLLAAEGKEKEYKLNEISEADILKLEQEMDRMDLELPELRNFILPGGHPAVSAAHICRTVCRRAERLAVELAVEHNVNEFIIKYLNRLSDYFFMLSRYISKKLNVNEISWNSGL
ncbi:MAG TPA: cob(I)yrinic acid a,c-diamide adenosyltransferase [Bacteroidales bacterium]|nr:cob(I)yrinic acid a,c-diamide adenosyltransferase [Bacteroidales bacterium]